MLPVSCGCSSGPAGAEQTTGFSLTLEPTKTKLVEFGRVAQRHAGKHGRNRRRRSIFWALRCIVRSVRTPECAGEVVEQRKDRCRRHSRNRRRFPLGKHRRVEPENRRRDAHFSQPLAMLIGLAPSILASWPTSEPTGPLAAATTMVSPDGR